MINNSTVIIIEDKVDSENHSGQLQRYVEAVENQKGNFEIPIKYDLITIYFKTGNQSTFREVLDNKYVLFERKDFLQVLKNHTRNISNQIFIDYLNYLQDIENKTESYMSEMVIKWSWWAWQGFLMHLFKHVTKDNPQEWENWKYINNPSGGFWGLFWKWTEIEKGAWIYLQLELEMGESKRKWLCFKVYVENRGKRSQIRDKLFDITKELCEYVI